MVGFFVALFFWFGGFTAFAAGVNPEDYRVLIEGRREAYFELHQVPSRGPLSFAVRPISLSRRLAIPGGFTAYPIRFPESDIGLISQWDSISRTFTARYGDDPRSRVLFRVQAPAELAQIPEAFTDRHQNLFWVAENIAGQKRLYHQNALASEVPLNEIWFREEIMKVRPSPSGSGVVVLLQNGQVLEVDVPPDFSLHVKAVNDPALLRVVDLNIGPLGDDPFHFSLVLFGIDSGTAEAGIFVEDARFSSGLVRVPLQYRDAFGRDLEVPMISAVHSTVVSTELRDLIVRNPSELGKFHQLQYQARYEEIRLRVQGAGAGRALIGGRRVVLDAQNPGLCRLYLLSNYGLSPDLWLN